MVGRLLNDVGKGLKGSVCAYYRYYLGICLEKLRKTKKNLPVWPVS
jgi:hypothetical protein